jgi:membrane protein DedA with SNARE-associated domain
MKDFLIELSTHHAFWVYLIIILTASAEGPILSIIGGVLIRLGYFEFAPIYIAVMLGDALGDTAWYWIGRKYGHSFVRRFGKYVSITEARIHQVTLLFRKYSTRILIISKITNGFGLSVATLVTAGMSRIPFIQYLGFNLIGQFVWSGMLIAVGYYFSHLYVEIDGALGKASVIGLLLLLIALVVGFHNYIKNKSEKLQ